MSKMFAVAFLLCLNFFSAHSQTSFELTLQKKISLPAGTGKFDHFAVDEIGNRLFIAATGNGSVEVLDLRSDEVTESLAGFGKPHGLAWISATKRLYVSDGLKAELRIFEGAPLKTAKAIKLSDDADDMVYDQKSKLLYVGHGGSNAANPASIAVINTTDQTLVTNISVSAHPEGLEIDNANDRIFVNIADAGEVVVIDGTAHTRTTTWKLTRAKDNVPLAYDEEHQILFVACRKPARLLVLDATSGKELQDLTSEGGADDIFYDAERRRVYLIAGSGAIDTYEIDSAKAVRAVGVTHTSTGAKTGLLVPSLHTLFLGTPAVDGNQAEIFLYSTK